MLNEIYGSKHQIALKGHTCRRERIPGPPPYLRQRRASDTNVASIAKHLMLGFAGTHEIGGYYSERVTQCKRGQNHEKKPNHRHAYPAYQED